MKTKELPAIISEKKIEIHLRNPYMIVYDVIERLYGSEARIAATLFPWLIDWDKVKQHSGYQMINYGDYIKEEI